MVWFTAKLNNNVFRSLPRTETEARADPTITSSGSWMSTSSFKASPVDNTQISNQRCHLDLTDVVDQFLKQVLLERRCYIVDELYLNYNKELSGRL